MSEANDPSAAPVEQDENKLIAERREKLRALRGQGIAFPNDFRPDAFAGDLQTSKPMGRRRRGTRRRKCGA